ncbi:spore germination protein [Bacillus sp. 165]|uniref:spore germination protein n=1 Tax=Bacillus sp. 165 TaxID=1529117 RepID=UPI001ADA3CBE|nr:spore germination protein [Bacillus sp. 165]MBO9129843.1 spore germination protein [Bacillus sp. 165]
MIKVEDILLNMQDMDDLVKKQVSVANKNILVLYLKTMVSAQTFESFIIQTMNRKQNEEYCNLKQIFPSAVIVTNDTADEIIESLLAGFTLLIDQNEMIKVDTYSVQFRSISPSEFEPTVQGPQDSLTESLETNLSLVRRRLRSPHLKTKFFTIGNESKTSVCVMYMENIANEENISFVSKRLKNITDNAIFSGLTLAEFLSDNPISPYPQLRTTGHPELIARMLLDGRIATFIDGAPDCVVGPIAFQELFITSDDYIRHWTWSSVIKILRFIGFYVSLLLTSSYVSVLTYHSEMLPPRLLLLIAQSRLQVPIPPVLEVLLIEVILDVIRESSSRMPTRIGQSLGIVGAIVTGTAAVDAGLFSNVLIVLASMTALMVGLPGSPNITFSLLFMRYIFIIFAGWLGMFGQFIALTFMLIQLLNLTSLGTPLFAPVIPRAWSDLRDSIILFPQKWRTKRMAISRPKQMQKEMGKEKK